MVGDKNDTADQESRITQDCDPIRRRPRHPCYNLRKRLSRYGGDERETKRKLWLHNPLCLRYNRDMTRILIASIRSLEARFCGKSVTGGTLT